MAPACTATSTGRRVSTSTPSTTTSSIAAAPSGVSKYRIRRYGDDDVDVSRTQDPRSRRCSRSGARGRRWRRWSDLTRRRSTAHGPEAGFTGPPVGAAAAPGLPGDVPAHRPDVLRDRRGRSGSRSTTRSSRRRSCARSGSAAAPACRADHLPAADVDAILELKFTGAAAGALQAAGRGVRADPAAGLEVPAGRRRPAQVPRDRAPGAVPALARGRARPCLISCGAARGLAGETLASSCA